MIPYIRLISEMERQLVVAKHANEEHAMREALAAVRSLCEVALGGEVKEQEKFTPKMMTTSVESSLDGTILVEEDANGGSLFEF